MKKSMNIFASLALTAVILSGCASLNSMKKKADEISYTVTPEVLETHADKVDVSIQGRIPEKFFVKKAVIEATPVLTYDGGEQALEPYMLQGESVEANNKVISYSDGGSFSYSGSVPYEEGMRMSELEIRITASKGNKSVNFDPVKVADGVVATSTLVDDNLMASLTKDYAADQTDVHSVLGKDNFQRIIREQEMADIHFVIQRSNIRNSELRNEDIQALEDYINRTQQRESAEFKNAEISAYASPDGPMDLNTRLSLNREVNAKAYLERELKKANVDKANMADFFNTNNTPEDWEGFKDLVQNSSMEDKELILRVLSMYSDPEVREREIKNLAAAYETLADDILPELRRSKLIVNVDSIGKSDEVIAEMADNSPEDLTSEELLYAATLTDDKGKKADIYKEFQSQFPNDWRGFNDLGYVQLTNGNVDAAKASFEKAAQISSSEPVVMNNLGLVALIEGDVQKAEEYLGKASGAGKAVDYNMGVLNIMKANYETAASNMSGSKSANSALANILAGNNDAAMDILNSNTTGLALVDYLKAVVGARTDNKDMALNSLENAVEKDSSLKEMASTDMEFAAYMEDSRFQSIVQ